MSDENDTVSAADQAASTAKVWKQRDSKLTKRLCYILRYGAEKENLNVIGDGFVCFDEMMKLTLLRHDKEEDVLAEIDNSLSHQMTKRFERKEYKGQKYVRASIGRSFEKMLYHQDTKVFTLFESCVQIIVSNIDIYDFEDFPDDFVLGTIIHRMKIQKKLNSKTLHYLLSASMHHLNLEGCFLTDGALKAMWTRCPDLRSLSLKDCGYVVTDNVMQQLLKRLLHLESLNLTACRYVTDQTIKSLCRNTKKLKRINFNLVPNVTVDALIDLMNACPSLEIMDVFNHRPSVEERLKLMDAAEKTNTMVLLQVRAPKSNKPNEPKSNKPSGDNADIADT